MCGVDSKKGNQFRIIFGAKQSLMTTNLCSTKFQEFICVGNQILRKPPCGFDVAFTTVFQVVEKNSVPCSSLSSPKRNSSTQHKLH